MANPRTTTGARVSPRPLVPIAFAIGAGILIEAVPWGPAAALALAGVACALAACKRAPQWLAVCGIFCAVGAWRAHAVFAPAANDIGKLADRGYVTIRGSLQTDADSRSGSYTCQIAVDHVAMMGGAFVPCSGRVVARLPGNGHGPFPEFGDLVVAHGRVEPPLEESNPGGFRAAEWMRRNAVTLSLTAKRPEDWRVLPASAGLDGTIARAAGRCRRAFLSALHDMLPPLEADLLAGIVLGSVTRLPDRIADDFATTGTSHVLAASGMNVVILAGLFGWLWRAGRLPIRGRIPALILLLAFYTLIAGAKPSVVRADLMITLLLVARLLHREPDPANVLAASAVLLMLCDPGALFDAGFQFSYAIVAAVLACKPIIDAAVEWRRPAAVAARSRRSRAHRAASVLATGAAVTVVAQLAAMPLMAQHFNRVSFSGLVANALIVPIVSALMAAGLGVWALHAVCAPVARLVAHVILRPFLLFAIGSARVCAKLPYAALPLPSPGWLLVALYYAAFGALIWWARARLGARSTGREVVET